jgi:hypothetical protein
MYSCDLESLSHIGIIRSRKFNQWELCKVLGYLSMYTYSLIVLANYGNSKYAVVVRDEAFYDTLIN